MLKNLFHVYSDFFLKYPIVLFICFLIIFFMAVISADTRPTRAGTHHRYTTTIKKHNRITQGIVAGGLIAYSLANPSQKQHKNEK